MSNLDLNEKVNKIDVRLARMETTLSNMEKHLVQVPDLTVSCAQQEIRINSLEKAEKGKWKFITALIGTIVTSMFALLSQLFNK